MAISSTAAVSNCFETRQISKNCREKNGSILVGIHVRYPCMTINDIVQYTHTFFWLPKPLFLYGSIVLLLTLVCCVFSSHPFWTSSSLDVPAGVTQEEGHTGFLIHLPSAVRALIFVARRIQPFLSLVDREVEFCVLTN